MPCALGCRSALSGKRTSLTKSNLHYEKTELFVPRSNSVSGALSTSFSAILPYSVKPPVRTTTAIAVPLTIEVPMNR